MGCCSFGGYELPCELDLYDCSDERNPRSMQKLNGTFNRDDMSVDGIFQLKFANGVPVKPNVKYALACRTSQGYQAYGQDGLATVNGPDGTKFDFSNTTYFHGTTYNAFTTIISGQLPHILYGTEIETGKQVQVSFKYCENT